MTNIIKKRTAYIQKMLKIDEDVLNDLVGKYVKWEGYDDDSLPDEFYYRANIDDMKLSCELVGRVDAFITAINIISGHYDNILEFDDTA